MTITLSEEEVSEYRAKCRKWCELRVEHMARVFGEVARSPLYSTRDVALKVDEALKKFEAENPFPKIVVI